MEELRKLAYTDLDQAMLLGVDSTIREMEERGYLIHTNTREARTVAAGSGREAEGG